MRDYQKECIEVIHNHFKTHDRQIIQLPTGSGKTWIFCEYLSKYSNKALIICPSIELKEQILDTAKRFNIKSISDNPRDHNKNHVVTAAVLSYENTRKILFSKNYDHIVIDEAHHANSKTYTEFLSSLINKPKILGCTATPERLDGKSLLDVFETLTYKKNIYELIKNGFLADILAYRIKTNQDIAKRGSSDFRATELRILDNESRNNLIYKTFKENCRDKKTIIFCISVEHCIKISDYLKSQGVNSAYIHGKMNNKKRQEILKKYKTGEIQVLTNCQLLTEGFDEPTIEAIIIARPTASKALYCQMIGRGLRKTNSKNICYLYELTDNNFKLCTFNVTCEKDPTFKHEYRQGIKLSELYEEIEFIIIDDYELEKEKIELFANKKTLTKNAIDLLKSYFYTIPATNYQKFWLNFYEIKYYEEINFLEAGFLLWKQELKKRLYGNNNN